MGTLWTIAHDGEIGYFPTYRSKVAAERAAAPYRRNFPHHTYAVVPEEPEQAAYALMTNSVHH